MELATYLSRLPEILAMIFIIIYAVVFHELAHGYVAYRLGDPTPKIQKRLTLNPIRHLSLFGSVIVPLLGILFFGFFFGWAKPVMVEPKNFKRPARDMAWVALAGPAANFAAAVIAGLVLRALAYWSPAPAAEWTLIAISALAFFSFISIFLGLFNLFPLPPLDGGHIVSAFLSERNRQIFYRLQIIFLILLMFWFFDGGARYVVALAKYLHFFITGMSISIG